MFRRSGTDTDQTEIRVTTLSVKAPHEFRSMWFAGNNRAKLTATLFVTTGLCIDAKNTLDYVIVVCQVYRLNGAEYHYDFEQKSDMEGSRPGLL
jgi:hypothetical protein